MSAGETAPRSILIAGMGAVGSVFACLLAEAGHRVTGLGRGAHLDAVARGGLRIDGIWGEHRTRAVRAVGDAGLLDGRFDAILVACRSFQTETLLARLGDRLAPQGRAISLQNGLGNVEKLAHVYGVERALAGRVIFGAAIVEPGLARVTVEAEPVLIGHPAGGRDRSAEAWAALFDAAGINCRASDTVMGAVWGKVFYNAALNPMGALLGLSYGELAEDALRRRVMDDVIEEAFAVARAEGVAMPWASAQEYRRHFYERLVPPTAGHRSSMLQALEAGKRTEIDAICGEVCRRGDAAGLPVTANRLLLALVRSRERLGGRA